MPQLGLFSNSSTSQNAPVLGCFEHFDFEMCFAAVRRFSFSIPTDSSAPAALANLLFNPPEPQNIRKTVSRDFSVFLSALILFLLALSSLAFLAIAIAIVVVVVVVVVVAASVRKPEI